uniref:Myb/SANT-like DNA-binding domain-containing protein n=2 Tax=Heliothis virescens TaxID=7102 RepID=A0A2A4JR92_HELVI
MSAEPVEYLDTEEVYMQLNQSEIMETDAGDDADDHWEHTSIKMLLNLYLQNVEKFRSPKVKKKNVWIDIANAVGKGPDCCDKKFRNLKQTYIRLLKKRNRNEVVVVKWPYFEVFEQIYNVNGEYQPEIQQRIQDGTTETVTKALLSIPSKFEPDLPENGESSNGQSEESRRKLTRRRYTDFRKITLEMRNRQRTVEEKLDRLINIVQESNSIQRERNRLFQQFLDSLQPNT